MMGHSNPLITLKIYTLVLDDEIAKSASALEAFIVKSALDKQAQKLAFQCKYKEIILHSSCKYKLLIII